MKILALEFSSLQRSVAISREADVTEVVETGSGANAPLIIIEEALQQAKVEREQIECIAIGLGPGSYTGIRSAIALAQGWQLARGVKLLGVSSVQGIAAQAQSDGFRGRFSVVIDAQREEFYLATCELSDAHLGEIEPLHIVTHADLQRRIESGNVLIGPEVTRWFPSGRIVFPRAAMLCHLAKGRTDFLPGQQLEPIYLRETKFVKAPPPRVIS